MFRNKKFAMKTETQPLEIYNIKTTKDGVTVDYSIFGERTIDVKNAKISKEALMEYVSDNGLNEYCEDVLTGEYAFMHCETYLYDNINQVVEGYLNANL